MVRLLAFLVIFTAVASAQAQKSSAPAAGAKADTSHAAHKTAAPAQKTAAAQKTAPAQKTAAKETKDTGAASRDAEKLFKGKCAGCHAADGSGQTGFGKTAHLHDLRSDEVQKATDAEMADTISKGKGKMPGYAKQLNQEQIKGLVGYVRNLAKKK